MSPSESDLRAALHDGEGDGVDPQRIIIRGQRARARRRSQLVNGAAVTVLVAGIGVGAALLGHSSGENAGSAAGSGQDGAATQGKLAAPTRGPASSDSGAAGAAGAAGTGCPSSLPRFTLPPTGPSGAPLFSTSVSSVLICDYGPTSQALGANPPAPTTTVLRGADAKAVVDSLERTSPDRPTVMCPQYRLAGERAIAIRGLDAAGRDAGLVTTYLGRPACATDVRNGRTVRYSWTPPEAVVTRVPVGGISHGPVLRSVPPS